MSSFRLVVLVVFCVCRIYVTDAALGSCSTGNDNCLGNAICNAGETECVCELGLVEDDGTDTCVKVLDGSCDDNADCSDSVANSECDTDTCKCATGYKEETNLCVAIELGDTCTTKEDCSTSVPNSECTTTGTPVCKCATGYKEGTNVCVASVLGGACGSGSACTPDNTECNASKQCVCQDGFIAGTGTKANTCIKVLGTCTGGTACTVADTVCNDPNCVCKDGFIDGEADTCVKVLGGSCDDNTDCNSVPNSECATDTCKCTTGYAEKDNVCVASGSGGTRSIPCVLLMASVAIFRFSFM